MNYQALISKLPGVQGPKKYLDFKARLKWTAVVVVLYLAMGQIPVFGITEASAEQFSFMQMVLGANIGSLITLGIGPIVTSSIILQLLVGSGILPWDTNSEEGQTKFQGTQKLLTIVFAIFESVAFVSLGAIQPQPGMLPIVVFQLALGAIMVLLFDEVVSKWGIGSGVSLFIAAGVTKTIFIGLFSPFSAEGANMASGIVPAAFTLLSKGQIVQTLIRFLPLVATLIVFFIVVYVQAIRVEIPLAFGSIRGFARRWPLKFIYTSVIPVILTGALLANLQLVGKSLGLPFLASTNAEGQITGGLLHFFTVPNTTPVQIFSIVFLASIFIFGLSMIYFDKGGLKAFFVSILTGVVVAVVVSLFTFGLPTFENSLRLIGRLIFYSAGATVFSLFWVQTSGMDSGSVADQIQDMGMKVPGFRKDPRIIRKILDRYIPPLAVMGGIFVGIIASFADFTGALGTGTGILLTVMILFKLYEQIGQQYMEDMNPAVRKFFEG